MEATNLNSRNYCVILAGGKGRRLWPCSREERPKQFIDFFGVGRTQLQQTFDLMEKLMPRENIFVDTNQAYAPLVREQLPEVDEDHILSEPIHRNTAPSVAWATHRIMHICPEASILVTPSDQAVVREEAFRRNILHGMDMVAQNDGILTIGVKPTRPEPGYGYIQMGQQVDENVYRVQSFTEKPEREFAKMFLESGEFLWNTGIFLSNAQTLFHAFERLLPVVLRNLDLNNPNWSISEENAFIQENFPTYPNISMDLGILEKSDNTYVMQCDFGWADLGTWHGIYEAMQRSKDDNVVIDSDVMFEQCKNNIVKLPRGRFAMLQGLDGFIIAEQGNVLLVCKKEDSSALVRKFVNEVQLKKGEEFI